MDESLTIVQPTWPWISLLVGFAVVAGLMWLLARRWLEPIAYSVGDQMRGPFRVRPFGRLEIEVPASMLASLAAPEARSLPLAEENPEDNERSAPRAADQAPWDQPSGVEGGRPVRPPAPAATGTALLGTVIRGLSGFKFQAGPELRAGELSLGGPVELGNAEELRFTSVHHSLVLRFYRHGRRALEGLGLEPGSASIDDLLRERERTAP